MSSQAYLLTYKAKVAEQVEYYTEMKAAMKQLVELGVPLEEEQRNLLSVAYKNVVGQRRTSWRICCSLEHKASQADEQKLQVCVDMRKKIEAELTDLCDEILTLLNDYLLKEENQKPETAVFFYKMKGDYLRYKVEITQEADRDDVSEKAKDAYKQAQEVAKDLDSTHPIRLGLALNFSVYYYEIANDPEEACKLAQQAFDQAMEDLDKANTADTYKDSTLIMQLLRDNLSLWRNADDDAENDDRND